MGLMLVRASTTPISSAAAWSFSFTISIVNGSKLCGMRGTLVNRRRALPGLTRPAQRPLARGGDSEQLAIGELVPDEHDADRETADLCERKRYRRMPGHVGRVRVGEVGPPAQDALARA